MKHPDENSFELRNADQSPTKQLGSAIDFSVPLDEINLLEPGSFVGRYIIRGSHILVFHGFKNLLSQLFPPC